MSRRDLIDPESRFPLDALLEVMPGGFNAIPDIVARRAAVQQIFAMLPLVENPDVAKEDRTVPGPDGDPAITVRIYRPVNASGMLPGIFFIHGGGMVLGDIAGEDATASMLCAEIGAVVVSVEYRLAPEHPHPAPVEDCYAGLVWTADNAVALGIDPDRLAIYGGSAGGVLTLGTALLARDRQGPPLRFIMPIYPMIDDTNTTGVVARDHRRRDLGPGGKCRGVAVVPRRQARRPVRGTDPRRRRLRAAVDVHRRRHRRPVPR